MHDVRFLGSCLLHLHITVELGAKHKDMRHEGARGERNIDRLGEGGGFYYGIDTIDKRQHTSRESVHGDWGTGGACRPSRKTANTSI